MFRFFKVASFTLALILGLPNLAVSQNEVEPCEGIRSNDDSNRPKASNIYDCLEYLGSAVSLIESNQARKIEFGSIEVTLSRSNHQEKRRIEFETPFQNPPIIVVTEVSDDGWIIPKVDKVETDYFIWSAYIIDGHRDDMTSINWVAIGK